jgi:hypothetical protein
MTDVIQCIPPVDGPVHAGRKAAKKRQVARTFRRARAGYEVLPRRKSRHLRTQTS